MTIMSIVAARCKEISRRFPSQSPPARPRRKGRARAKKDNKQRNMLNSNNTYINHNIQVRETSKGTEKKPRGP